MSVGPPRAPGWGAALAQRVAGWADAHGPGLIVGVGGPQGCGKTTACAEAAAALEVSGRRTVVLSLDDLYLARAAREQLARDTHPLLRTRGPPRTHDVALGVRLLDALRRPGVVRLPRFSKATDDREEETRLFEGPADVVMFEGWCIGVRPDPSSPTSSPLNRLEREEDADGAWRGQVEAQLAGAYAGLWARMDRLVLATAPDWSTVCAWRGEAEAELRARTGGGMSPAELARFMDHYERLTRRAAADPLPDADHVIRLDADRRPRP